MIFRFDPIALIFTACDNLYGDKVSALEIDFVHAPIQGKKKLLGVCEFFDDDKGAAIAINSRLPIMHIPDIVAHEVAHYVLGSDCSEHGQEWEVEVGRIRAEYNRLADVRCSQI